jgi:hypothetical protein
MSLCFDIVLHGFICRLDGVRRKIKVDYCRVKVREAAALNKPNKEGGSFAANYYIGES